MLAHNLATARHGLIIHQSKTTQAGKATAEAFSSSSSSTGDDGTPPLEQRAAESASGSTARLLLLEGSYLEAMGPLWQDVVFFDPPWPGEGSYKGLGRLGCDAIHLGGKSMLDLCASLLDSARFMVWKLPCTFHVEELTARIQPGWRLRSPVRWKGAKMLLLIMERTDDAAAATANATGSA